MEDPIPLSALRRLSLIDCDDGVSSTIFKPSILPSLKVLACLNTFSQNEAEFESLLPQLDLLIVSTDRVEDWVLESYGDKILTDCRFLDMEDGQDDFPFTQHFRLRCKPLDLVSKFKIEVLREAFDVVHNVRNKSGIALKTLFLDHGLYHALGPLEGMQSEYDRLIKMCERDGTEIILEEQMNLGLQIQLLRQRYLGGSSEGRRKRRLRLMAKCRRHGQRRISARLAPLHPPSNTNFSPLAPSFAQQPPRTSHSASETRRALHHPPSSRQSNLSSPF